MSFFRRNWIALLLGVISSSTLYWQYKRDKADALRHLRLSSQMTMVNGNSVEYTDLGIGMPILFLHGSGNGYQQADLLAQLLDLRDYRIIAPSRSGYVRTPLGSAPSNEEQADLFASLLDKLRIDQAHVIGFSAGGLSALTFAQRHPERCQSLVMLSATTPLYYKPPFADVAEKVIQTITKRDFLFWLGLMLGGRRGVLQAQGASASDIQDAKSADMIDMIAEQMFPSSKWSDGLANDIHNLKQFNYDIIPQITVPTTFIHGTEDRGADYSNAQKTASYMQDAQFITIEGGTHIIIGTHHREITSILLDTLQ